MQVLYISPEFLQTNISHDPVLVQGQERPGRYFFLWMGAGSGLPFQILGLYKYSIPGMARPSSGTMERYIQAYLKNPGSIVHVRLI
jgi:hypothetical protein